MNLQDKINRLAEYDTLVLEFDEYFEKIEINKPITIDGGDSTICFTSGPVLTINSKDVELRNVHLEVTSSGDLKDKASPLALDVKGNIHVSLEKVIVKGDVKGVISENGAWRYPDVLNIWPVAPFKTNYFVFEMDVPVSCALETEIEDLRIINPALSPGLNQVLIEVSDLKKDIILFGQIGIQSAYLKRMINVCGGAFGVPDDIAAPDKSKPIALNLLTSHFKQQSSAGQRKINRQRSDARALEREESTLLKITNYDLQKYKQYLKFFAIFIIIALMASVSIYLIMRKSVSNNGEEPIPVSTSEPTISTTSIPTPIPKPTQPPNSDKIKPEVKLSGIKAKYNIGDKIQFHIEVRDNNALRQLRFEVKKTAIRKQWDITGLSDKKDWFFRTDRLNLDRYDYTCFAEDASGNIFHKNGYFDLEPKRKYGYIDIVTEPSVEIHIEGQYIGRTPIRKFKYGAGKIKMKFVNHYYGINETRIINIEPDKESIKNIEYPIKYGYLNINTKPWATMTIYGREIGMTPKANLKLPAGNKTISFVNKEYKIDTTREVSIIADRSINLSFDLTQ